MLRDNDKVWFIYTLNRFCSSIVFGCTFRFSWWLVLYSDHSEMNLHCFRKYSIKNAIQFLGAVAQSCPMMIVTVYLSKVCSSMLLFTTWNKIFPISFIAYCFLLDLWCCQISIICMLFSLLTVKYHRRCLLMWFFFLPAFLFYNHVFFMLHWIWW